MSKRPTPPIHYQIIRGADVIPMAFIEIIAIAVAAIAAIVLVGLVIVVWFDV